MNLLAFIREYNLVKATAPLGVGGQCVDLAQLWYTAQGGQGHIYRDAVAWAGYRLPGWRWVPNGPDNWPLPGDLVVWGKSPKVGTGAQGHIAIALLADAVSLLTFDQNWSWTPLCRIVHHPLYAGVLGWHTPSLDGAATR